MPQLTISQKSENVSFLVDISYQVNDQRPKAASRRSEHKTTLSLRTIFTLECFDLEIEKIILKNNIYFELIVHQAIYTCHQRIKWLTWELNIGISSSKALFLILLLLSSLCFFCTLSSLVELFIHFWFELSNYNCIFWRHGRVIKTSHIHVPFINWVNYANETMCIPFPARRVLFFWSSLQRH